MDAEASKKGHQVAAPSGGDRSCSECIFDNQVPADDPGKEFAEGGIAIGIGGAGHGNNRGKLGVPKAGKDASGTSKNEGNNERSPGNRTVGGPGKAKDSR